MTKTLYCFDTSALLDGIHRNYPPDQFKTLWENIDELVESGQVFASEEVWEDVKVQDDDVKNWVEARKARFVVPTDGVIAAEVASILQANRRLVMNMKGRNRSDPFVIAVARIRGATVVTGEGSDGTENRPKIPFICEKLSVPCVRLLDVIRAEGWVF